MDLVVASDVTNIELAGKTARLVESFLSGRSEKTIRAYRRDLEDFAKWLKSKSITEAANMLLKHGHGDANMLALEYRHHLVDRELAPATINRRLASLRSLVKLAETLGMVPWSLQVPNLKSKAYRDTRGPGRNGVTSMLAELGGKRNPKALRDTAIVRLLYDLALRRAEVCRLDMGDLDLPQSRVAVLGKGRTEKEWFTLPEETQAALEAWLAVRGDYPGPLFTNFDRARKGDGRLTPGALYKMIRKLGHRAAVSATPHKLRHAAITDALDATNGNVRMVQRFSRHATLQTVQMYDDSRSDMGGEVAALIANRVG